MVVEALIPGVEDGENAQEQPLSRRHVEDCLGRRSEEGLEGMDSALAQEEGAERRGNGEDEMKVTERKQMLLRPGHRLNRLHGPLTNPTYKQRQTLGQLPKKLHGIYTRHQLPTQKRLGT